MAAHMAAVVRSHEDLELLAEPSLSICCFRHVPPGMSAEALNAHNERLLALVQRDGRVYLSGAHLDGLFALRACVTNYRTTPADVERAVEAVRELASG